MWADRSDPIRQDENTQVRHRFPASPPKARCLVHQRTWLVCVPLKFWTPHRPGDRCEDLEATACIAGTCVSCREIGFDCCGPSGDGQSGSTRNLSAPPRISSSPSPETLRRSAEAASPNAPGRPTIGGGYETPGSVETVGPAGTRADRAAGHRTSRSSVARIAGRTMGREADLAPRLRPL